jgi:hypothetical protein
MLKKARFRFPDIFLGALLAVAIFAMGAMYWSSQYAGQSTQAPSASHRTDEESQGQQHEGLWNWLTHDAAGFFAVWLVIVGGGQLVLFYVQLKLIRESLIDAKIAADAAKEAADAAVISAEHLPRVERAYLFLSLEVKSSTGDFVDRVKDSRWSIEYGFTNHGKTPAIIEELDVMASFWGSGWPAVETATRIPMQKGWAISAGESQGGYSTEFPLRADQIKRAMEKSGYILFWGKVVYRDVFGASHESGWCRAYEFENDGWSFAGDESLNYYT